jgi:hypothetical protein
VLIFSESLAEFGEDDPEVLCFPNMMLPFVQPSGFSYGLNLRVMVMNDVAELG